MSHEELGIPSLVSEARRHVGSNLRLVASYEGQTSKIDYIRDGLEEQYSPERFEFICESLIMDGLHEPYLARIFSEEEVRSQILGFGSTYVLHFSIDQSSGYVITVDRDGLPELDNLIEECRDTF